MRVGNRSSTRRRQRGANNKQRQKSSRPSFAAKDKTCSRTAGSHVVAEGREIEANDGARTRSRYEYAELPD